MTPLSTCLNSRWPTCGGIKDEKESYAGISCSSPKVQGRSIVIG